MWGRHSQRGNNLRAGNDLHVRNNLHARNNSITGLPKIGPTNTTAPSRRCPAVIELPHAAKCHIAAASLRRRCATSAAAWVGAWPSYWSSP